MSSSNKGRQHFTLDSSLRVQSATSHSGPSGGLVEDASRKHIATFSQPVQGPLELSTMQHMATQVHEGRLGKKKAQTNTVALFHESSLPTASATTTGKTLDVRRGSVFNSSKDKSVAPTLVPDKTAMTFDKDNNNNHLNGIV